ncbi:MAG: CRISPR-associated endonuclease Cas2 [Lachnospiraceae bacterium]|jgi:CRISPR-associated protein Cas2|nr:CRISPR-associated endonuclease Cas2 [Lachnospiraceae bacterium]MDY3990622.1 CRISPR-associated endonuclease Cas2 [Lachnospiraceae bacterium]
MLILVTYDVDTETNQGRKRLRHVAKICTGYGIRVQNSVFECNVDASQLKLLRKELLDEMDKTEDSIRLYNLGNNYHNKVEHYGTKETKDLEDILIF